MQAFSCAQSGSLMVVMKHKAAVQRSSVLGVYCLDVSHFTRITRVRAKRARQGFTLIELMVALAVGAVLVMIAVPSFQNITLSNRLTTTANDIVNAIAIARIEAIKLNAVTQLCSDSATKNTAVNDALGKACTTQTGAVYALTGTVATQVRAATAGIAPPLQLSGDLAALRFSTAGIGQLSGTPYSNPVVDICTSAMSSNNHRIINMTTGSIITTSTTSGACP